MATTEYGLDSFFTQGSTSAKLVWDVAGAIGWSPHNQCLRSQEFNQTTPWNPTTAVTITADATTAPDGTTTADKLVEAANSTAHQLLHSNIGTITGANYTFSVYAKAAERTWISLSPANVAPADWFDIGNGVVGTSANAGAISSVGGGWYRCSITFTAAATQGPVIHVRTSNGQTGSYAGDGTSGVYLWGAQFNRGLVPLGYLPTTTAARFGLAVDYHPVTHTALGLLVEPTATNILLASQVLATQTVTVTAVAYTLSFYGTGTITLSGVSTAGPLVGTGAADRVSLTFTPTAGSLTLTVTGTVSEGQLETGAFATSPIRTFTTTVTRSPDNYTFLLSQIPTLGTEYSIYCRFSTNNVATGAGKYAVALTDGTLNEFDGFWVLNTARLGVTDGGTAVGAIVGPTLTADTLASMAARIKLNDCSMSVAGGAVGADTTVTLPTVTEVRFGGTGNNVSSTWQFRITKLVIVPRAWTDTELPLKSAA
jgi:hypothetical protein